MKNVVKILKNTTVIQWVVVIYGINLLHSITLMSCTLFADFKYVSIESYRMGVLSAIVGWLCAVIIGMVVVKQTK